MPRFICIAPNGARPSVFVLRRVQTVRRLNYQEIGSARAYREAVRCAATLYQYQILQEPSGWKIRLSDRFGEVRFTPKNP